MFFCFFFLNEKLGYCCQVAEKDEAASMKSWILRYAQQSSDDEEEEEGEKRAQNPELEEKFDPVREKNINCILCVQNIG